MTIRHLRVFVTVADCGKMSQAAKELYISQPSVSQAIQEIENEYGVKLFERLAQKLYITDIGQQLLPYARHMVDSFETIDHLLKQAGELPVLRIGASISVGTCLLFGIINRLEEEYKQKTKVVINNTLYVEHMILNSELDVAIVEGVVNHEDIIRIPLCKDELVVIVGKGHPFYEKKMITLDMLDQQEAITREDGSNQRNQYEKLLNEEKISLIQKCSCSNTEAIKNVVKEGKYLSILSRMLVKDEVKEGALRIVPVENIKVTRDIKLIYHKNKFISGPLLQFIDCSKKTIGDNI